MRKILIVLGLAAGLVAASCDPPMGQACGDNICPQGMVCCNSSCGICTPPDGACIQIACE